MKEWKEALQCNTYTPTPIWKEVLQCKTYLPTLINALETYLEKKGETASVYQLTHMTSMLGELKREHGKYT